MERRPRRGLLVPRCCVVVIGLLIVCQRVEERGRCQGGLGSYMDGAVVCQQLGQHAVDASHVIIRAEALEHEVAHVRRGHVKARQDVVPPAGGDELLDHCPHEHF